MAKRQRHPKELDTTGTIDVFNIKNQSGEVRIVLVDSATGGEVVHDVVLGELPTVENITAWLKATSDTGDMCIRDAHIIEAGGVYGFHCVSQDTGWYFGDVILILTIYTSFVRSR
ncbi:MAG: hypothetical protein ORO03_09940 [Alphaproteobacteria bacterium]|nr:hypothetical protein [Alphaproteobacteria bacterium]